VDEKPAHRPAPGGAARGPHYWENLVERQIREAMQSGGFDDLPFQGERLPDDRDEVAGDWALANRMLRSAGIAPPWIEADKEARRLMAEIQRVIDRAPRAAVLSRTRERARLAELVDDANRAIDRVNAEAPTVRQHRLPVDVDATMRRLEEAFEAG
jgi:hypothetical protein